MNKKTEKRPVKKAAKKPAKQNDREIVKFVLKGFGTDYMAKQEAMAIMSANVDRYRSDLFPLAISYKVEIEKIDAEVVKTETKVTTLYPWYLDVSVTIKGEPHSRTRWITALLNKVSGYNLLRS